MKRKSLYSTMVIFNPQWGIVSSSQKNILSIFKDNIRLGSNNIPYDKIMNCRFEYPCVKLRAGKENLVFGIQARIGCGKVSSESTFILANLIQSACNCNQQEFYRFLAMLKATDKRNNLHIFSKIIFVISIGVLFGLFYEWFLLNPRRLLLFPVLLIIGNIIINSIFGLSGSHLETAPKLRSVAGRRGNQEKIEVVDF